MFSGGTMKKTNLSNYFSFNKITMALVIAVCCHLTAIAYKPPVQGLVDMGNIAFYDHPGKNISTDNLHDFAQTFPNLFGGTVINVTWAQLEPTQGQFNFSAITQALQQIQNYNDDNAHKSCPLSAKLRVWGGFTAPEWAKKISDGAGHQGPISIDITKGHKPQSGSIGLFWSQNYIQAWRELQSQLATQFDNPNGNSGLNALLTEVAVTSCASNTDEPFVSWLDQKTVSALKKQGYTDAQQEACLKGVIQVNGQPSDYSAWKNTLIDYPFNPFHDLDGAHVVLDTQFTLDVMASCNASPQCVLSNHALTGGDIGNSSLGFIFNQINQFYDNNPATVADYQTASPKVLASSNNNWTSVIQNTIDYHGKSIELWPDATGNYDGFTGFPVSQITAYAKMLGNANKSQCPFDPSTSK